MDWSSCTAIWIQVRKNPIECTNVAVHALPTTYEFITNLHECVRPTMMWYGQCDSSAYTRLHTVADIQNYDTTVCFWMWWEIVRNIQVHILASFKSYTASYWKNVFISTPSSTQGVFIPYPYIIITVHITLSISDYWPKLIIWNHVTINVDVFAGQRWASGPRHGGNINRKRNDKEIWDDDKGV